MKKTIFYLLLLIGLSLLAYFFVFKKNSQAYDEKEANFTVKDTADIQTIYLSNLQNQSVKIGRTPTGWILNDTMAIRMDAVNGLLKVLHDQIPDQPVSKGYHDAAIRELSGNATKVEIYNHSQIKTHTFYVGRNPAPNNATYMLNEGAKRPYIVKLPLQNTFVGVRYFSKPTQWRSKKILFAESPIERVQVDYKDSIQHSFTLTMSGDSTFQLSTPQPSQLPLNINRAKSYLRLLNNLYCTGFETTYVFKDSIINKGIQMATVTLKRKNRNAEILTFYFKPTAQDTKATLLINGKEFDFNYFFGYLNNADFMVLNRKTVETILRKANEFRETE